MNAHKHFFYRLLTLAFLVFALAGIARADPPGVPFQGRSLALGSQFDTVRIRCGSGPRRNCYREETFSDPVGRPYLLHYVNMTGSSSMQCSFLATVQRELADDILRVFLGRLNILGAPWNQFSSDSTVITFPVPIRGEAVDRLGIWRFPEEAPTSDPYSGEACHVQAIFGIEYLDQGDHGHD